MIGILMSGYAAPDVLRVLHEKLLEKLKLIT